MNEEAMPPQEPLVQTLGGCLLLRLLQTDHSLSTSPHRVCFTPHHDTHSRQPTKASQTTVKLHNLFRLWSWEFWNISCCWCTLWYYLQRSFIFLLTLGNTSSKMQLFQWHFGLNSVSFIQNETFYSTNTLIEFTEQTASTWKIAARI